MASRPLRIGTRGSRLALWQANFVADLLRPLIAARSIEIVEVETTGDRTPDRLLTEISGEGVFTKEIQRALLTEEVDIAVHSLKDLPTDPVEGLTLGALATHGGLARAPEVRAFARGLTATFAAVATVRIREQATLGGNLAHADPAQDPPVTLLALDGVAVAMSKARARRIPLDALFVDVFETSLEPDEILLRVERHCRVEMRVDHQQAVHPEEQDVAVGG